MVVEVAAVHEVEDEAEFVLGVEGVGHADNEGAVVACADQAQHYPLVEGQGLPLLHLNALLIKTLKQAGSHSHSTSAHPALSPSPSWRTSSPCPPSCTRTPLRTRPAL